jgi:hypothetical protein
MPSAAKNDICSSLGSFHQVGGIGVAGERDAECVANLAVRAVAGGEIGDVDGFLFAVVRPKRGAHAVSVLLEGNELDMSLDLRAEARQISGQQALRPTLRQLQDEGKSRVQLVEGQVLDDLLVRRIGRLGVADVAGLNELVSKAKGLQDLQRARLDAGGTGFVGRPVVPVDDAAGHAMPAKLGCHEQAHRTCAHHQYLGVSSHRMSFCAVVRRCR